MTQRHTPESPSRGAPARGERVAKYNRLLEIAADRPELLYRLTTAGR